MRRALTKEQVEARLAVARKQSEHYSRRLRILRDEQQKLIQLSYRNLVSEEVLQSEQQHIEAERAEARRWVESTAHEVEDVMQALDEALAIVGNCHETYLAADPDMRRLMNQAIFEQLLLWSDDLQAEVQPVFAHLASIAHSGQQVAQAPAEGGQEDQSPRLSRGFGSNYGQMVLLGGQLYNPSSSLERVLAAPAPKRDVAPSLAVHPGTGRLGNGVVKRAVIKVLAVAKEPMRGAAVHLAVEHLLGHPVSKNSVSWCLAAGARSKDVRFERVAHGCYRLRERHLTGSSD